MRRTLLTGIAAAVAGIGLAGCSLHDTYTSQYYVTILNDTSRAVMVWQCDDTSCDGDFDGDSDFHDREQLEPGESTESNVSTRGVPNPWLVTTLRRRPLGCLPFVVPKPVKGVVGRVSQAIPCRDEYDEDVPWPPRRPAS